MTTTAIAAELETIVRDVIAKFPDARGAWIFNTDGYTLPAEVERVRVCRRTRDGVLTARAHAIGSAWCDEDRDLIPITLAGVVATVTADGTVETQPARSLFSGLE